LTARGSRLVQWAISITSAAWRRSHREHRDILPLEGFKPSFTVEVSRESPNEFRRQQGSLTWQEVRRSRGRILRGLVSASASIVIVTAATAIVASAAAPTVTPGTNTMASVTSTTGSTLNIRLIIGGLLLW